MVVEVGAEAGIAVGVGIVFVALHQSVGSCLVLQGLVWTFGLGPLG